MSYNTLLLEQKGMVAILTLNRPPMNSVNYDMIGELREALDVVAADRDMRALVITGAGEKSFCAGMDVEDAQSRTDVGFYGRLNWSILDGFDKPTIAAINGHALGGGCELTLACHFRFMTSNPKALIGTPEVNLGVLPGWCGTQTMTRLLGRSKALEIMLFGKRLNPEQALEIGMVNGVFPQEELMPGVMELATQLSEKPPISVRSIIRASTAFSNHGFAEGYRVETAGSIECGLSKDYTEGLTAFIEKRKPVYTGE